MKWVVNLNKVWAWKWKKRFLDGENYTSKGSGIAFKRTTFWLIIFFFCMPTITNLTNWHRLILTLTLWSKYTSSSTLFLIQLEFKVTICSLCSRAIRFLFWFEINFFLTWNHHINKYSPYSAATFFLLTKHKQGMIEFVWSLVKLPVSWLLICHLRVLKVKLNR